MLNSSTGMRSSLQKKKQPIPISQSINTSTSSQSMMNRTSLSSISTTSQNNKDEKLSQLKQRLEKQRQSMRSSTGRRFRDGGKEAKEIQIQTEVESQNVISGKKEGQRLSKGLKVSTGVGSNGGGLFDFGSLKAQVENKMKGVFTKKPHTSTKDTTTPIIPVYTTKQILQMANNNTHNINKSKQQSNQQRPKQLKRQVINLMQLSQVISNSVSNQKKRSQLSRQKITSMTVENNNGITEQKFVSFQRIIRKNSNNKQSNNQSSSSSSISILSNSHVFQTAINQQKQRNNQVKQFLSQVKLQKFADELISMGFDQIQTLIEVSVEELNMVKMRAREQDRLFSFIKEYKRKNNIQDTHQQIKPLVDKPSVIKKSLTRPMSAMTVAKTQPSQLSTQNSRLRSTSNNFNSAQSTLLNKSSIFYFMGGDQWSLQSQIRKACSGCFKVSYQAIRRGQCYYCEQCDPGEDSFEISLNMSMVRDYR